MNAFITKFAKGTAVGALAFVLLFGGTGNAHAQTASQLSAQIQALLAQIAILQAQISGGGSASITFTRDLTIGSTGGDVTALQNWLIARGYTIPAGATGYFGAQTRAALASYQATNGITPPAGYFGPITRARINASVTPNPNPTPTPNPDDNDLSGGAGSIDEYVLMSSLNNEEVGEDEEDVEIAGLDIDVDDGSDIRLTAVRLVFDEGTATRDFDRFAEEVSIYLDGDEVARVDADEFTDRNNWTKTITLDDSAIIERGENGELTVAVSGARNIDSADVGKTWTVDFRQIRFVDADGTSITEDPSTSARTFSFEAFSTASNLEVKISDGDDDINDSRVIDVDATSRTRNEAIFSFNIEVEGNSDVELDSLPIEFTTTGAGFIDDMLATAYLEVDGDRVGSENIPTDENTLVFDDLNLTLEAGEEYEFVVKVDFLALSGALDEGDTISATIGETETNSASFDAEDESGEDIADNDISGSATGGAHVTYDAGIKVTLVSVDESVNNNEGADNDSGAFAITYRVESFGGTVYISDSAVATTASSITAETLDTNGVIYRIEDSGAATVDNLSSLVTWKRISGNPTESGVTNGIRLNEGDAAEFTLTVVRSNSGDSADDGLYRTMLKAIGWNTNDSSTFNVYNFNLEDFRTGSVYLN